MAAPEVARTAAEMAGKAVVLKVDTEKYPALAGRFNVRGIPNFAVFSGGRLGDAASRVSKSQSDETVAEHRRCGFCLRNAVICTPFVAVR